MQTLTLTDDFIAGALSTERIGDALYPCRLPLSRRHFFPSPDDLLLRRARMTSGVRLRFESDARTLRLRFAPLPEPERDKTPRGHAFDLVLENEIAQSRYCAGGAEEVVFDTGGARRRVVEIWLPPSAPVGLRALETDGERPPRPAPDPRPLWVTWGSSLTHCVRAGSAARIWPGTVARRHNLNLMCLGFGGQCHLDPLVALTIRDLPARYLSMKLGINASSGSVNARTYPALVAAAIQIVREGHPRTPLAMISPICCPHRETTPNPVGYTLQAMRADMERVCRAFQDAGDLHLHYVNGLELFGPDDIAHYAATDGLHPNAEGIDLQAERFSRLVMPRLLADG